jgi:hypothetical protein
MRKRQVRGPRASYYQQLLPRTFPGPPIMQQLVGYLYVILYPGHWPFFALPPESLAD